MSTRNRGASRDLRSQSPVKQLAPAARPKATPRRRRPKRQPVTEATPSVADSVADSGDEGDHLREEEEQAIAEAAEEITEILDATAAAADAEIEADAEPPLKDNTVRVSVTSDVLANEDDTETTRTTVRVELPADSAEIELPQDTEGVVQMARDIIQDAKELQEAQNEAKSSSKSKKSLKRKADTLEEEDEDEVQLTGPEEIVEEVASGEAADLVNGEVEMRPAKRTRIMVPAEEYRREKVKRRALMGLSGALAVGVMIPFLSNLF